MKSQSMPDTQPTSEDNAKWAVKALVEATRWMLALIDGHGAMPHPEDGVTKEMRAAVYYVNVTYLAEDK